MRIRLIAALLILGSAAAFLVPAAQADEEAKTEAIAAAKAWLELIDKGDTAKSWETSAELFRGVVTQEQWEQAMAGARNPLGNLISRKVDQAKYQTQMPGAPDGEYVVIQFKSVFENKSSAVETVTPMKDPDGKWRVSGYYIK